MPAKIEVPKPLGLPPEITDIDVAFPAHAMDWLPAWEDIPSSYKTSDNPWAQQIGRWFFKGPDEAWMTRLEPKEDVDPKKALRVVQACLGSFAPKHEHKIAGVAYMMATWFTDPELKT